MLSEPPRCRPVPVLALKGADSPRGLHRGHSPGHWSPPGARSTGGGWSLPASWPDPNSLRQVNPDHDETYRDGTVNLIGSGRDKAHEGRSHEGLCPSGHAGDRGPGLEGLGSGGPILAGCDVIAAEVEEIVDPVMGREEALSLAG